MSSLTLLQAVPAAPLDSPHRPTVSALSAPAASGGSPTSSGPDVSGVGSTAMASSAGVADGEGSSPLSKSGSSKTSALSKTPTVVMGRQGTSGATVAAPKKPVPKKV